MAADGKKEQAARVLAKRPQFPYEVAYLWDWFGELTLGLKVTGMAPVTASWGDILEWEVATGRSLEPWERIALAKLSNARAIVQSELQQESIKQARNGHSRPT